jgi:hypothetical protein
LTAFLWAGIFPGSSSQVIFSPSLPNGRLESLASIPF